MTGPTTFVHLRCEQPGWELCFMNDPAHRRGVWRRTAPDGALELCWGRHGDDGYVALRAGEVLAPEALMALGAMLRLGAFLLENEGAAALPVRRTRGGAP